MMYCSCLRRQTDESRRLEASRARIVSQGWCTCASRCSRPSPEWLSGDHLGAFLGVSRKQSCESNDATWRACILSRCVLCWMADVTVHASLVFKSPGPGPPEACHSNSPVQVLNASKLSPTMGQFIPGFFSMWLWQVHTLYMHLLEFCSDLNSGKYLP